MTSASWNNGTNGFGSADCRWVERREARAARALIAAGSVPTRHDHVSCLAVSRGHGRSTCVRSINLDSHGCRSSSALVVGGVSTEGAQSHQNAPWPVQACQRSRNGRRFLFSVSLCLGWLTPTSALYRWFSRLAWSVGLLHTHSPSRSSVHNSESRPVQFFTRRSSSVTDQTKRHKPSATSQAPQAKRHKPSTQ